MRDNWLLRVLMGGVVVFVISLAAVYVFSLLNSTVQDEDFPVSDYPLFNEYQKLKDEGRFVTLVSDFESYTPGAVKKEEYIRKGNIKINNQVSKAYLYIDVSVDDGQKLTRFDSVYLRLNGFGGHLLRNLSEEVPGNHTTRLLFDLREIPFLWSVPYNESRTPNFTSWLKLLNENVGGSIPYETFVSSLRPGGTINEMVIVYECGGDSAESSCLEIE